MNNNTHIELLKQYQAGTISEADRHVLERAALDDPFLFEAMEGFSVYGSGTDTQVINSLKALNSNKTPKVRWLNMRTLTVAASLIALLAITFLMTNQLSESEDTKQTTSIVSNDSVEEKIPMAQTWSSEEGKSDVKTVENNHDTEAEEMVEDVATETMDEEETDFIAVKVGDVNATATVVEDVIQDVKSQPSPQTVTKDIEVETTIIAEVKEEEMVDEVITPESIEENMDLSTATKSKSEQNSVSKKKSSKPENDAISYADTDGKGDYILGKVLDTNGNHLIGANVFIENTEIGAVTDIEGNFKLPKYESGHQMVASYTGYKTQKLILGDIDFYQIVMPISDDLLSEVIVTKPKEVNKNKAFPSMGMEDFELYISENKEYPLEVFGTTKSGTFEVSFNVNIDGSLSNFVDESENCDACFEEAVKLLKGSGKWETKPAGEIYRTSYMFEF